MHSCMGEAGCTEKNNLNRSLFLIRKLCCSEVSSGDITGGTINIDVNISGLKAAGGVTLKTATGGSAAAVTQGGKTLYT